MSCLLRLLWSDASITSSRRPSIVHGDSALRLRRLSVRLTIGLSRRLVSTRIVTTIVVGMAVVATGWLRDIWNNLHTTGDDTSGSSTACGVSRGRGTTETLGQLLEKRAANIVCGNMHCVSDTKNHERAFC